MIQINMINFPLPLSLLMESKLNPLLQGYLFITPEQHATSSLLSVYLTLITMNCPFFTAKSIACIKNNLQTILRTLGVQYINMTEETNCSLKLSDDGSP